VARGFWLHAVRHAVSESSIFACCVLWKAPFASVRHLLRLWAHVSLVYWSWQSKRACTCRKGWTSCEATRLVPTASICAFYAFCELLKQRAHTPFLASSSFRPTRTNRRTDLVAQVSRQIEVERPETKDVTLTDVPAISLVCVCLPSPALVQSFFLCAIWSKWTSSARLAHCWESRARARINKLTPPRSMTGWQNWQVWRLCAAAAATAADARVAPLHLQLGATAAAGSGYTAAITWATNTCTRRCCGGACRGYCLAALQNYKSAFVRRYTKRDSWECSLSRTA